VVFNDTPGEGETEGFYRVEVMEPELPTPTLLSYDPFPTGGSPAEYDPGSSAGQAPTTLVGFDGGWGGGDATIESAGLTFPGLPASGGRIQVTDSTNGGNQNNTRLFDQTYDDGTYYFSFLLRANRTGGAFQAVVRLQFAGADLARLGVQNGNLGLADATGAWAGTTVPNDALEHLLVAKLQIDPVGGDTIDLFVDPVPGDPEPASPLASLNGEFAFDGFRLFNNPGSATETIVEVDEIRLATSWEAATPASGS
jgi:hypothetical protein